MGKGYFRQVLQIEVGEVNGSKEDDALQVEGGIQAVGCLWEHSRSFQEVAWSHAYQDQGENVPT